MSRGAGCIHSTRVLVEEDIECCQIVYTISTLDFSYPSLVSIALFEADDAMHQCVIKLRKLSCLLVLWTMCANGSDVMTVVHL